MQIETTQPTNLLLYYCLSSHAKISEAREKFIADVLSVWLPLWVYLA